MNDYTQLFDNLPNTVEKLNKASPEEKERMIGNIKGYFDRDLQ